MISFAARVNAVIIGMYMSFDITEGTIIFLKGKGYAEMTEEVQKNEMVIYQKQVTANEPNAYSELTLKFEGLRENRIAELRELFNKFFAEVERMVLEDTSLYM